MDGPIVAVCLRRALTKVCFELRDGVSFPGKVNEQENEHRNFFMYGRISSADHPGMFHPSMSSRWARVYVSMFMDEPPPKTLPTGTTIALPAAEDSACP